MQARLDFWLISEQVSLQIKKCEIKPGIKSYHSLVKITLDLLHTEARVAVIGSLIILILRANSMSK